MRETPSVVLPGSLAKALQLGRERPLDAVDDRFFQVLERHGCYLLHGNVAPAQDAGRGKVRRENLASA